MVIGGAIYYYRIRTTKTFSATDYKEEAKKQRDEIRSATREINTLKCEMHEIKDMLTILLDRK